MNSDQDSAQGAVRAWKLPAVWLIVSLLLASLVGLIIQRTLSSGQVRFEATTMLGVIGRGADATPDGAQSAAKQWAAVGASTAFLSELSDRTHQPLVDTTRAVAVDPVLDAPALTVTVRDNDRAKARSVADAVAGILQARAKAADSRYPLQPLTSVAVVDAPKGPAGLIGAGAGVLTLGLGVLLLMEFTRRSGRHARDE